MVSAPPPITMGWLNLRICQNFVVINFFLTFAAGPTTMGEVKNIWGVKFIDILPHFHYFIFLEKANTLKSAVLLLRISSGNKNTSIVTCQYAQMYNFSFRKKFL